MRELGSIVTHQRFICTIALIQTKVQNAWGWSETNPPPHELGWEINQHGNQILSTWGNEQGTKKWMGELHARPLLPQATAWGRRTVLDASLPSFYEWCSSIQRYLYCKLPALHRPQSLPHSCRNNLDLVWTWLWNMSCSDGHRGDHIHWTWTPLL